MTEIDGFIVGFFSTCLIYSIFYVGAQIKKLNKNLHKNFDKLYKTIEKESE